MTQYIPALIVDRLVDKTDNSKGTAFVLTNPAAGILATFDVDCASSQAIHVPDNVGTLVGTGLTQTLTGKTLTDVTNTVRANSLRSGSTVIALSTDPQDAHLFSYSAGGGGVAWVYPSARYFVASVDSAATASVGSYTLLSGMQVTPTIAGTYFVQFDAQMTGASAINTVSWAIFVNGVSVANSVRSTTTAGGMTTQAVISWTTGTVELRWITGLTATVNARSLVGTLLS